ncbi:cysteine-rich receptor-like protein kinase 15 [Miscanthus floridulus]|uniref:cysteine-rich receptor-like protein kinase 15 n=1 Tax=Miscanthus floridulus TaxID=154761 RepID=UPI00345862F4
MPNGDLERNNCGSRADWSSRLQLIDGIAQGVYYLHRQGIVHMDLKPSNILLDSDMNAKITDFGISRTFAVSTTLEITTDLMGTMGYMAPEYVLHGEISWKVDVYAFGVILLGTIISGMCKGDSPASGAASIEWAREARDKSNQQLRELFDPSLLNESSLLLASSSPQATLSPSSENLSQV